MVELSNFLTWNQYMLSIGPMVFEVHQTAPPWQYSTQSGTAILPSCWVIITLLRHKVSCSPHWSGTMSSKMTLNLWPSYFFLPSTWIILIRPFQVMQLSPVVHKCYFLIKNHCHMRGTSKWVEGNTRVQLVWTYLRKFNSDWKTLTPLLYTFVSNANIFISLLISNLLLSIHMLSTIQYHLYCFI